MPANASRLAAICPNSSTANPAIFTTTCASKLANKGHCFSTKASSPGFCKPMELSIPAGVSTMRWGGLPPRGCGVMVLVTSPPKRAKSVSGKSLLTVVAGARGQQHRVAQFAHRQSLCSGRPCAAPLYFPRVERRSIHADAGVAAVVRVALLPSPTRRHSPRRCRCRKPCTLRGKPDTELGPLGHMAAHGLHHPVRATAIDRARPFFSQLVPQQIGA